MVPDIDKLRPYYQNLVDKYILGELQSQVYRSSMTQNIERKCACFQEKCIARAAVNESVYVSY